MGASTHLDSPISSTIIIYQAEDTFIYSLIGSGSPVSLNSYTDNIVLNSNIARNGTPLAIIADVSSKMVTLFLIFIQLPTGFWKISVLFEPIGSHSSSDSRLTSPP